MYPILYDKSLTVSTLISKIANNENGIAILTDCTSCTVEEERNGAFTLQMEYPVKGRHFSDIETGCCLLVKPNPVSDYQLFRIYEITTPYSRTITVYANHISYDLNKTSVLPFSATGAVSAVDGLKDNQVTENPFTFSTDITNTTSVFTNSIPQSARALLGGQDGSILDVFGGEYEFDNEQVILHASRGTDRGFRVAYGKNLTDLEQDKNIENCYTAVLGYATDTDNNTVVGDLLYVDGEVEEPKILNLDLSSEFTSDDGSEVTITKDDINTKAQAYIDANDLATPTVSIDISFVDLAKTEEYKEVAPLLQLNLCDTVYVDFPSLNISTSAKMISYEYDVIMERYNEIEIGEAKSTLQSTIIEIGNEATDKAVEATGYLDNAISAFTSIIANGLGLYMTKVPSGSTGAYIIYLHNAKTLAESQYQWTINSSGFAVSQDYGATWSAGFDTQGNAIFNSLSANEINSLKIVGSLIRGSQLIFGDTTDKYVTVAPSDDAEGITFDGTGSIDMKTVGDINLLNERSDGSYANRVQMRQGVNSNNNAPIGLIDLYNYEHNNLVGYTYVSNHLRLYTEETYNNMSVENYVKGLSNLTANTLSLYSADAVHRLMCSNYQKVSENAGLYSANSLQLSSQETLNEATIVNYTPSESSEMANRIYMRSASAYNEIWLQNRDKTDNSNYANHIGQSSTTSNNSTDIYNRQIGSSYLANRLMMVSNSNSNQFELINLVKGRQNTGNRIYIQSGTNGTIEVYNYDVNNVMRNKIVLTANSVDGGINITNYNSSGVARNDIQLYIDSSNNARTMVRNFNNSGVVKNWLDMYCDSSGSGWMAMNQYGYGGSGSEYLQSRVYLESNGNLSLYANNDINLNSENAHIYANGKQLD